MFHFLNNRRIISANLKISSRFRALFVILLIFQLQSRAQGNKANTVSFNNEGLSEVFEKLESTLGINIYYLDSWLDDTRYTLAYDGGSVAHFLEHLLESTPLNSYQYNPRTFIITRNRRIYDQLPPGFWGDTAFEREQSAVATAAITPVFFDQEEVASNPSEATFYIGKQGINEYATDYTLSGLVRHRETGKAVADVTVLISNLNKGSATDENGFFQFQLPAGVHQLETRFVGMRPTLSRLVLYSSGFVEIFVEDGVQQLDEVVVEARQDLNVEEVLAGTDRIDAEDSKEIPLVLGERNLLKIATTLPGISSAGEGAIGVNVRGGRSDQNQFLLNGATIYNPTHFFGLFQALNPFVVDRVDIYKGVIPVNYGGRLSAVFDMQTISGDTTQLKGEGSVGPVTSNLALEIPADKGNAALVIGGRLAYSDWILRSLNNSELRGNEASFYDLIATYTNDINSNNRIRATAYYSKDRFSLTPDSLMGYNNRVFALEWNRRLANTHNLQFNLSNSHYGFTLNNNPSPNAGSEFAFALQESEFKFWDRFRPSTSNQMQMGLSIRGYRIHPGALRPLGAASDVVEFQIPQEQAIEAGLFVSNRIELSERMDIDAGLRWTFYGALGPAQGRKYTEGLPRNQGTLTDIINFNSGELVAFYNGPEFRTAARFLFSENFSIRAGFNSMYQYLHALSNTTTVSPIDTWKLSDSNIRPQRSTITSLGFFRNSSGGELELSLEGYYKWSDDVLDFKSGARILLNDRLETEVLQGDGKSYGLEFLVRKNKGRLNGWVGYTWSRSLIRFASKFASEEINNGTFFPSNYDRPHDLSLIANYRFTRRYSASLNFAYQTGRPITYPVGQFVYNNAEYVMYSDRNRFRIPDYYRLDLGVNIEGNHKKDKLAHSFWTVSVYNVLGRNNPYSVYFVTQNGEVKALRSSIFAIPVPSITYNFKF